MDAPSGAVHQLDPAALAVLTAAERLAAPPDYAVPVAAVREALAGQLSVEEVDEIAAATKPACQSCWARSWCGGGCQANGYEQNGSIYSPYQLECRLRRKRLELALWLQAERIQA